MGDIKEQGKLEEYRALHEEMSFYRGSIHRNRNYCITLFIGIVGFGIQYDLPILFVVAWLMVFYYWRAHGITNDSIAKISCFVSVFLEDEKMGLTWHTCLQPVEKNTAQKKIRFNLNRFTSPYSVMSLGCMLGIILKTLKAKEPLIVCLSVALAVILNAFLTVRIMSNDWKQKREVWLKVWQQRKSAECSG